MAALSPTILNAEGRLYMRVWFSTDNATFEQLNPDVKIVNPEIIGSRQPAALDLYVNNALGNDNWPGLRPSRPKKTIQAAIDTLPARPKQDINIHVAPGIYREEVFITGISVRTGYLLSIIGNETWEPDGSTSPNVRVTGSDDDSTRVRSTCFTVENCLNIEIRGVYVDYANSGGILVKNSTCNIKNSKAENNYFGIYFASATRANANDIETVNNDSVGMFCTQSVLRVNDKIYCNNNGLHGIGAQLLANITFGENTVGQFQNNGDDGVSGIQNSSLLVRPGATGTISGNTDFGVAVAFQSFVEKANLFTNSDGVSVGAGCNSY
jgi:hypothetical protein